MDNLSESEGMIVTERLNQIVYFASAVAEQMGHVRC